MDEVAPVAQHPGDAPPAATREHPLGILIVVLLGVGRLVVEIVHLLTIRSDGWIGWIASGSSIPEFQAGSAIWYLGQAAIVLMIVVTAASIVGLWRWRTWGWSLALIVAGVILALDLGWWFVGLPRYPSMFLNMVAVFYLNQRDVRAIFLPSSL
jgi:hypothetical protein